MKKAAIKLIIPGSHVLVKIPGELLKKWDVVEVFNVERGLAEPLYGCYCAEKDLWEQLPARNLRS